MDKRREYQLNVPLEGASFSAMCAHVADELYRLESIPLCVESIAFGDIFEADCSGNELRLRAIVEKAGWNSVMFILTESARQSDRLKDILRRVESLGGVWEQSFGGMLGISLPPTVTYDPTDEVQTL